MAALRDAAVREEEQSAAQARLVEARAMLAEAHEREEDELALIAHPIHSAALVAKVYGIVSYWSEARYVRPMTDALAMWAACAGIRGGGRPGSAPPGSPERPRLTVDVGSPSSYADSSGMPSQDTYFGTDASRPPSSWRPGMPRGSLIEQVMRSPASKRMLDAVPATPAPVEEAALVEQRRLETELQRHKNRMAVSMWSEAHARGMLEKMTKQHDELFEQAKQLRAELSIVTSGSDNVKRTAAAEVEKAKAEAAAAVEKAAKLAEAASGMDAAELEKLRTAAAEVPSLKAKRDSMQSMCKMYQKKAEANVAELDELRIANAKMKRELDKLKRAGGAGDDAGSEGGEGGSEVAGGGAGGLNARLAAAERALEEEKSRASKAMARSKQQLAAMQAELEEGRQRRNGQAGQRAQLDRRWRRARRAFAAFRLGVSDLEARVRWGQGRRRRCVGARGAGAARGGACGARGSQRTARRGDVAGGVAPDAGR